MSGVEKMSFKVLKVFYIVLLDVCYVYIVLCLFILISFS